MTPSIWPHPVQTTIDTLVVSGLGCVEAFFEVESIPFHTTLSEANITALSRAGYPTGHWIARHTAHRVSIAVEAAITRSSIDLCILPRNDDEIRTVLGADLCEGDVLVFLEDLRCGHYLADPSRIERFDDNCRSARRRVWVKRLTKGCKASFTAQDERAYFILGPALSGKTQGF
jgi:hypothetical protein